MATIQIFLEQAETAAANHHFTEAIQHYDSVIEQTQPTIDEPTGKMARQKAWRERGRLFDLLSNRVESLASYKQYYLEANDPNQIVDALILIGNQYQYIGEYDHAFAAFTEAQQLAKLANNATGRAQAYCGIGIVQVAWGQTQEGIQALQIALALFKQTQNRVEQIRTSNRIGVAYIKMGQIDKAIQAFLTSRNLVNEQTNSDPTALTAGINALNNLGECYQMLYELEKAIGCHRQGLAIAESKALWSQATDLYRNLGVDLILLGQISEGLPHLSRALELSNETNQLDMKLQSLYSLAWAEIQLGNLEQGFVYGHDLANLAQKNNVEPYQAYAFFVLGLYHQQRGDINTAEEIWHQGLFLAHKTEQLALLWQIHAALASIAQSESLRQSHYTIAAEIILQIVYPIEDKSLRQKFLDASPIKKVLQLTNDNSGW